MNPEIHKTDVQIPLHRKIAENLISQVKIGKLKPGQRLPSERQIARQFSASRATVRTALQHLEQSGLIARRERRSALVTIRRDVTPSIRLVCTSQALTSLMTRLDEMMMLPARSQIHLIDLQQPGAIDRLMSTPAMGADAVICDFEYVHCFKQKKNWYQPIDAALLGDFRPPMMADDLCLDQKQYTAVPLAVSPMVLYRNRALLGNIQPGLPLRDWQWGKLEQAVEQIAGQGCYALQIRPDFNQMTAIMQSRGTRFFAPNGHIAAGASPIFDSTLRLLAKWLHTLKAIPILAKAEQINVFAQKRAALAIDGFDHLETYRHNLGDALEIGLLPKNTDMAGSFNGVAAVIMPGNENNQIVTDLLLKMLSTANQRLITQLRAAMPIRTELLNEETFEEIGIPATVSKIFLEAISRCGPMPLPANPDHKAAVENLLLELWLNLDSIDSICQRFRML